MDEFVGLIVEQLARRAREPQKRAAAVPGAPPVRAVKATLKAKAKAAAPRLTPPPPSVPIATPAPNFDGGLGALPSLDAADPFGGVGSAIAPGIAAATGSNVASPLLGAFAGGGAFLRAFVLAEALAPPVALREPKRP